MTYESVVATISCIVTIYCAVITTLGYLKDKKEK